jgi:hypothetical protein
MASSFEVIALRNVPLDCDSHFGDVAPEAAQCYTIQVSPVSKFGLRGKSSYHFYLLLPEVKLSNPNYLRLAKSVIQLFLEDGDHYVIKEFTKDDYEYYQKTKKYVPVLSFDPRLVEENVLTYFWVTPPRPFMN